MSQMISYGCSWGAHKTDRLIQMINRTRTESHLRLDDAMMCIESTINDLSLRYNVEIFRLKK